MQLIIASSICSLIVCGITLSRNCFWFGSVEEAREFLDKCKRYIDAEIVISMEDYITLRNLNDGNDNFTVNSLDAATTWDNLDDVKIVNHWNNFILIFPEPT